MAYNYTPSTEDQNRRYSVKQLLETQSALNDRLPMGSAWRSNLSVDHFLTAIMAEFGELLDQPEGPVYKWWGSGKVVENYSEWMTRLEIVDVVHFYLSISILQIIDNKKRLICEPSQNDDFDHLISYYVGTDRHSSQQGTGIVWKPNVLLHERFMEVVSRVLNVRNEWEEFEWIDTLDMLVSSAGMDSETFSGLYAAKAALNQARWDIRVTSGSYQKVNVDGVEDNERLFPLVQAFLDDPLMTLVDLRDSVFNEFYEEVII